MLLPTPVAFATPWWIVMQPTVGCSEKEGKIFFVLQKEWKSNSCCGNLIWTLVLVRLIDLTCFV
jgi:hypothetical protein